MAVRPWRVAFQIVLYAALAAHFTAWYGSGWRSVGTISAASLFYFLQVGLINAGVVLLGVAILSILPLGNAFCGWACHFGALQDFATWLFRRIGIQPPGWNVPFRLRAILLIKLLVVNTLATWLTLGALPTFFVNCRAPEPLFAIGTWLTVLLDVAMLAFVLTYVFGPRAFCRTLCPVILVTRIGNFVAPGRMRLRGDCIDCGACDRACPMKNPVSRQLRESGSVRALDCVRCGRCRDACPVGAIGYSFSRR